MNHHGLQHDRSASSDGSLLFGSLWHETLRHSHVHIIVTIIAGRKSRTIFSGHIGTIPETLRCTSALEGVVEGVMAVAASDHLIL